MRYNIFDSTAPAMPNPSKGTEFCKLLLSQASKDMREPLVPMAIPALAAHLTDVEFMYSDNKYYELCGQMGHLIGPSGVGKAQLSHLIEAIMRHFRQHDETEYKKLVDWQRQVKTRGANKEKPERPEVSFWFPPADLTNPAFIQNAMALEKLGGRTQYMIWFCYFDLWSKVMVFGDMFKGGDIQSEDTQKSGPKNMLDSLSPTFNEQQLEALRMSLGKSKEGTKHQLRVWKFRKFITYSAETGLYTKTASYLRNEK